MTIHTHRVLSPDFQTDNLDINVPPVLSHRGAVQNTRNLLYTTTMMKVVKESIAIQK